jgi:hypothetical protein
VTVLSAVVAVRPAKSEPRYIEVITTTESGVGQSPSVYVDKGACPGEGCAYREWVVWAETKLFRRPGKKTEVVGIVRPYEIVHALTGEVWTTKPGRVTFTKDYKRFRRGDQVELLTYFGEGLYRIRHHGAVATDVIPIGPDSCTASECWGRWESGPESTWWIQGRTSSGRVGWTDHSGNFGGTHPEYDARAGRALRCLQDGRSREECSARVWE